jgi:hypothetical protein
MVLTVLDPHPRVAFLPCSPGRDQADLVAGADRENAADDLLEQRAMSLVGQREHRRFGKWPDRPADPPQRQGDVEWPLPRRYATSRRWAGGA